MRPREYNASMSIDRIVRPRRSFIFSPGLKPEMFPKALASGADIVCVELEDGIAPKDKDEARLRALALFEKPQAADGQIQPGVQPAGRYAHLTYSRYALRGNQALSIWAKDNDIALDNTITSAGEAFVCRYEAYLTDYRIEPRKTKWQVDLAIKLKD